MRKIFGNNYIPEKFSEENFSFSFYFYPVFSWDYRGFWPKAKVHCLKCQNADTCVTAFQQDALQLRQYGAQISTKSISYFLYLFVRHADKVLLVSRGLAIFGQKVQQR